MGVCGDSCRYRLIDVIVARLRGDGKVPKDCSTELAALGCILNGKHGFYRANRRPRSVLTASSSAANTREVLQHCAGRFNDAGGWELLLARLGDPEAIAYVAKARQRGGRPDSPTPGGGADTTTAATADASPFDAINRDLATSVAAAHGTAAVDAPAVDDSKGDDTDAPGGELDDAEPAPTQLGPWLGFCECHKVLQVFHKVCRSVPPRQRSRAVSTFMAQLRAQPPAKRVPRTPAEEVRVCVCCCVSACTCDVTLGVCGRMSSSRCSAICSCWRPLISRNQWLGSGSTCASISCKATPCAVACSV